MNAYAEFLNRKQMKAPTLGRDCTPDEVNPILHHWQRELVAWAVRTGRAAMWEDTGLGKTFQQIEWARLSGDTQLIIAPLAVCQQTVREAAKLGIEARYVRSADEVTVNGMWVTNYERVQAFQPELFDAVVLDESSCLKQSDGKTRTMLIEWAAGIPHRLACSATPAPNDPEELTNQAEWLGRMSRTHMLAAYFIHDQDGWRIKGHARAPMIRWMAQWAVALTKPSDVGGDDTGYILPGLEVVPEIVASNIDTDWQLFATDIGGVTGRATLRRKTLHARVERAAKLVADNPGQSWILWCGLNSEADALADAIPGAVNVHGGLSPEDKALGALWFTGEACICTSPLAAPKSEMLPVGDLRSTTTTRQETFGDSSSGLVSFLTTPSDSTARPCTCGAAGPRRVMISKTSILGSGLNFQHCHNMAFVGLGDSFEMYYQAIRRCYRYGQTKVVRAHVIVSELESQIAANVAQKEKQANQLTTELVAEMRRFRGIHSTMEELQ